MNDKQIDEAQHSCQYCGAPLSPCGRYSPPLERQREGCAWCDRAWSIRSSIEKLTDAAGVLLFDHDYDGHGYEEMQVAMRTAIDWLAEQDQLAAAPEPHTQGEWDALSRFKDDIESLGKSLDDSPEADHD